MKKKRTIIFCAVAILILLSVSTCAAAMKLSPALDIIANQTKMVKSGQLGDDIAFTAEDFEDHLGILPSSITVTSLPSSAEGKLILGTSEVTEGQTISNSNFGLLKFTAGDSVTNSSFSFTADKTYTVCCEMVYTEGENSAPVVTDRPTLSCVTLTDITCYGALDASDPDGDSMIFEIVEYPEHGLVSVTDISMGYFSYTPYDDISGIDSFTYRARDEFGNYSEPCRISVSIKKSDFDDNIDDMTGHWAESAAISMVENGYMNVISENGSLFFDPDENMTREEFLYTVMNALGTPKLADADTPFFDDEKISAQLGGYVAAAYNVGIISGEDTENGKIFRPDEKISRAEAAVILNNILGLTATGDSVKFDDLNGIPSWAVEDIEALASIGIVNGSSGSFYPEEGITKAEVAHMLFLTKNIFE